MTNFLLAAAVVCLAVNARMLWLIGQFLGQISRDIWLTQRWNETFWRRQLDGPEHICNGERIWVRRGLDRDRQFVWDVGSWNASSEITDLGGSICQVMTGTDVNAKEA